MANQDQAGPAPVEPNQRSTIRVGNHFRLSPGFRLPELDLDGAEAIAAHDDEHPDTALFARICAAYALPRVELMGNLKHMKDAAVLHPLEWGWVSLPGMDRPRLAVIFERPEHGVLMPADATQMTPLAADHAAKHILAPAVLTLGNLAQRGVTHQAIRPSNIYWSGKGRNSIILGDCVTDGPAMTQPAMFETISSAMTPPIGRGEGLMSDDFYALGVTLLIVITGQCGLFGASDAEVVDAKISRGSYTALMGHGRLPFGWRDVLRGLLADNVEDRWQLGELEQWLIGGKHTPVQEGRRIGAARAFTFDGREYTNCRALAHAFAANQQAGAIAGADPDFEKWLKRNIADDEASNQVRAVLRAASASGSRRKLQPRQLTRVCAALDTRGPIRYKGLIAKAPALGNVLADACMRKDKAMISLVGEVISSGLASEWYLAQSEDLQMRYDSQMRKMKNLQLAMNNGGIGHGIERCLYTLSPSFACFSDVLEDHFVTDVRDLLPALEDIVNQRGQLLKLVDRHLAAFIAARGKVNLDRRLAALDAAKGDITQIRLGMLGILATLQHRYGPMQLPCLTEWLAAELESAIGRFGARSTRDEGRKRLAAAAGGGRLTELNAILNNEKSLRTDGLAKKKAMREFVAAGREIQQLESKEFQDSVRDLGWRIASGISATVAGATVVVLALS